MHVTYVYRLKTSSENQAPIPQLNKYRRCLEAPSRWLPLPECLSPPSHPGASHRPDVRG